MQYFFKYLLFKINRKRIGIGMRINSHTATIIMYVRTIAHKYYIRDVTHLFDENHPRLSMMSMFKSSWLTSQLMHWVLS